MGEQHEGEHAGIGDLQDHARRGAGELLQQRAVVHDDLLGRLGRLGRGRRGRLLDPGAELLHEGQRLAQAFELALQGERQEGRLRRPVGNRRNDQ